MHRHLRRFQGTACEHRSFRLLSSSSSSPHQVGWIESCMKNPQMKNPHNKIEKKSASSAYVRVLRSGAAVQGAVSGIHHIVRAFRLANRACGFSLNPKELDWR
uniref:Uncharacterized protein n=1 Tax=Octactis speculum TaxID=3111310 RepID=A0A7S2HJ80_9STRA